MIRQPTPYPFIASDLYSEYLNPAFGQIGNNVIAVAAADAAARNHFPGVPFGPNQTMTDAISYWISLRPWMPRTVKPSPQYKTGDVYLRNFYGG